MKRVNRMKRFAILFAVVGALVGCSDSGGGSAAGGVDTFTITIDGVTTVYTESGTDPEIGADGDVAGTSVVGLTTAGNTYTFVLIFPGVTVGSYTVAGAPPDATVLITDSTPSFYAGVSGTVNITAFGGVGGQIVGEIPDLILGFSGDVVDHPASVSFAATRET